MSLFINEILSSIIQLILFAFIPFVWWLVTMRKRYSFFQWIGLKWNKTEKKQKLLLWVICTIVGYWIVGEISLYSLKDVPTATSVFSGLGFKAMPAIITYAVFHTALSEELFFRGFLLKRIANKFNFQIGNAVQSLLFGLLHGGIFLASAGPVKALLLILFTGAIAWTMGYINEKKAGGSIISSWVIHGIVNILSGISEAF